ncbi:MAG: LacI family DNA-binding transcriptional regulator [Oscillospiraceae bacterium]|nr:LacI family DNA-binding transcriptional regulator [Oscillospiraceae bacterium]
MTLRELARLANVSASTASKAFSGARDISPETRELVFETARQYGCYGKFFKGRHIKQVIAIICPEVGSAHYDQYIEQLQSTLEARGIIVVISTDHFDDERQTELLEYYDSYLQVDGIIVFGLKQPLKKGFETPIISIGGIDDPQADCISSCIIPAIREAAAELIALGHKKVAFIGEKLTVSKQQAFEEVMTQSGLEFELVVSEERFENAGVDGVQKLLEQKTDATALVCGYDYIALGAMRCLTENGYRIPEDFSVIGMDNISVTEYLSCALTTIDSHIAETCEIICDLLDKKMANPHFHVRQKITVTDSLVLRNSVGPVQR